LVGAYSLKVEKPIFKIDEWDVPEIRESFSFDLEAESFGFEAGAIAIGALGVGAVTGEEDADMHLVRFGFHPVEESANSIPFTGFPEFVGVALFSFEYPFLILFRQ